MDQVQRRIDPGEKKKKKKRNNIATSIWDWKILLLRNLEFLQAKKARFCIMSNLRLELVEAFPGGIAVCSFTSFRVINFPGATAKTTPSDYSAEKYLEMFLSSFSGRCYQGLQCCLFTPNSETSWSNLEKYSQMGWTVVCFRFLKAKMAETRPKITHVIFDVDGLLLGMSRIRIHVCPASGNGAPFVYCV